MAPLWNSAPLQSRSRSSLPTKKTVGSEVAIQTLDAISDVLDRNCEIEVIRAGEHGLKLRHIVRSAIPVACIMLLVALGGWSIALRSRARALTMDCVQRYRSCQNEPKHLISEEDECISLVEIFQWVSDIELACRLDTMTNIAGMALWKWLLFFGLFWPLELCCFLTMRLAVMCLRLIWRDSLSVFCTAEMDTSAAHVLRSGIWLGVWFALSSQSRDWADRADDWNASAGQTVWTTAFGQVHFVLWRCLLLYLLLTIASFVATLCSKGASLQFHHKRHFDQMKQAILHEQIIRALSQPIHTLQPTLVRVNGRPLQLSGIHCYHWHALKFCEQLADPHSQTLRHMHIHCKSQDPDSMQQTRHKSRDLQERIAGMLARSFVQEADRLFGTGRHASESSSRVIRQHVSVERKRFRRKVRRSSDVTRKRSSSDEQRSNQDVSIPMYTQSQSHIACDHNHMHGLDNVHMEDDTHQSNVLFVPARRAYSDTFAVPESFPIQSVEPASDSAHAERSRLNVIEALTECFINAAHIHNEERQNAVSKNSSSRDTVIQAPEHQNRVGDAASESYFSETTASSSAGADLGAASMYTWIALHPDFAAHIPWTLVARLLWKPSVAKTAFGVNAGVERCSVRMATLRVAMRKIFKEAIMASKGSVHVTESLAAHLIGASIQTHMPRATHSDDSTGHDTVLSCVRTSHHSRLLGYLLFWNLRPPNNFTLAISQSDVQACEQLRTFKSDAWRLLDRDGDCFVTLKEVIDSVVQVVGNRDNLVKTMRDSSTVINQSKRIIHVVLVALVAIGAVALFNPQAFSRILTGAGAALITISFVFGNSLRQLYENCVFLFMRHPFDVGDVVRLDGERYTVDSIHLQHVEATHISGLQTNIPLHVLCEKDIVNKTRSQALWEGVHFACDNSITLPQCHDVASYVVNAIESDPGLFGGLYRVSLASANADQKVTLCIFFDHANNGIDAVMQAQARTRIVAAAALALRELHIHYTIPFTQDNNASVHTHTQRMQLAALANTLQRADPPHEVDDTSAADFRR